MTYDTNSLWHQIKATATDKQSRAVDLIQKTKWYCFAKNNKSDYPSPPPNRKQYPLGRYWGFRYEGVATPHLVSAVPSGSRLHARKRPLFYFTIICTAGSQVKKCVYIRIDIKKKGPTINWKKIFISLCFVTHMEIDFFFFESLNLHCIGFSLLRMSVLNHYNITLIISYQNHLIMVLSWNQTLLNDVILP